MRYQKRLYIVRDVLKRAKLAKWPLVSVCPVYLRPQEDVFVKPTTAFTGFLMMSIEGG